MLNKKNECHSFGLEQKGSILLKVRAHCKGVQNNLWEMRTFSKGTIFLWKRKCFAKEINVLGARKKCLNIFASFHIFSITLCPDSSSVASGLTVSDSFVDKACIS